MTLLKLKIYFALAVEWLVAQAAILTFKLLRLLPFEPTAAALSRVARALAPILPRSRVAMDNLRLAFPQIDDARRTEILRGMWDNFFRSAVEFIHLDKVIQLDPASPDPGRVEIVANEQFFALRDSGDAAIIFTAHLANWELMPISAAKLGLKVTSVFRPPNNRFIARFLLRQRSAHAGALLPTMAGAGYEIMGLLERGGIIGQLVDQRFRRGVEVPFFGHPAKTNTFPAKLVRQFDCAIYGARAIRLPGSRFRIEMTDRLDPPRDNQGHVDIEKTTAMITAIVEGWVREHPEQWLWLHRRWER
ncbi:Lipid A biosynthesis lauroyl acyltransferase [hydrothermal vent metagenome]|uniref:Lipid A biosynthesis lauroyl acyltransferase n=1 Tax=hydrothermal vent metagenome TaxID=652676 RepID=A0A3B0TIT7_9ZZZZ